MPTQRSMLAMVVGVALLASAAPVSFFAQTKPAPAKAPSKSTAKQPAKTTKKRTPRPRPQKAPTADRIREIQAALAQRGFYEGEPNGKWDARSTEAMKKFQSASDLTVTGKLDAKSLQKLGLGSEVAGAAAPRAPANETKPQTPLR